jgi:hypothetical protein
MERSGLGWQSWGLTCTDGTEIPPTVVADNFGWVKDPDNGSTMIGGNHPC